MFKSEHIITTKHYLILTIIAFATGIYLTVTLEAIPLVLTTVFLVVLFGVLSFLLLIFLLSRSAFSRHIKYILLPLTLIFCVCLGVFRVLSAEYLSPSQLKAFLEKDVWLSGTVASPVTETSTQTSVYFEFRISQINEEKSNPETIVMFMPNYRGSKVSEGDQIRCWTRISLPRREDETDNLDYYTHLRSENIFYIGKTQNFTPITLGNSLSITEGFISIGESIKRRTISAINGLIPENEKYAAVLKGIIIGDKSNFSDNLYNKFSNAGISHIVAVSGLHLSVLFSVIVLLLYRIRMQQKFAYLLAIPVIVIFSSATGFTPSVCRSALMVIAMIISIALGERHSPLNALFLSMGIILTVSPYSLFSKSLLLSFGATFGILVYFEYMQTIRKGLILIPETKNKFLSRSIGKTVNFIFTSLAISVSAFVGTVYFCAIFFGSISKVQFLTNLWIVPVANATFLLGYIACLVYYIFPQFAIAVFFYPLRFLLKIITMTADIFGADKFAYKINSEISPAFFVVYIGGLLLLYFLLKVLSDMQKEKAARKLAAKRNLRTP